MQFQGIGGGCTYANRLLPLYLIFFPIEKRGKMTGLLGAVFGSSSVLGPFIRRVYNRKY